MEQAALKPRIEATYNVDNSEVTAIDDVIGIAQKYVDDINPDAEAKLTFNLYPNSVFIKIGRNVLTARTHEDAMHEAEVMVSTIEMALDSEESSKIISKSGTGHYPVDVLLPRE
jgi:hypothetical protein